MPCQRKVAALLSEAYKQGDKVIILVADPDKPIVLVCPAALRFSFSY
jgi:hypothetical protein